MRLYAALTKPNHGAWSYRTAPGNGNNVVITHTEGHLLLRQSMSTEELDEYIKDLLSLYRFMEKRNVHSV